MTKCKICDCELGELPMCFGFESPASLLVPSDEYESRVVENADQCIVDDKQFFVRGHIEVPVLDMDELFVWSAWVSLSEQSFNNMSENWYLENRENSDPYFGWLMNNIPVYSETLHLEASVQTQPLGNVPLISIVSANHVLSEDQRHGITKVKIHEIVHQIMQHAPDS